MNKFNFKKGDWCYCQFKLQQIMETTDSRITEVSDGYFRTGSHDHSDECFPVTMDVKRISDDVEYWYKEFHNLKNNALNHPDLHRKLVEMWVEMCLNKDDEKKLKELYVKLNTFGKAIVDKIHDLNYEEINGVRLFRQ